MRKKIDKITGELRESDALYTIMGVSTEGRNPEVNTDYYTGSYYGNWLTIYEADTALDIPESGTITKCFVTMTQEPGTDEPSSIYLTKNAETDYLVSNNVRNGDGYWRKRYNNTSLNIPVVEGDTISLKWHTPDTWATPPLGVGCKFIILIEK